MYTLNRLFFLSLGIVFLMVIPFFWGSVAYNFTALENFIVKITQSKLVGYPIPELFGMSQETDLSVKVLYLERILSVVTFFYGAFFIGISFIPNGQKRWKFLALSLATPMFLILLSFWIKFNYDDHIIGASEKEELLQFTLVLMITSFVFTGYGMKKPKVKRRKPPSKLANLKKTSTENQEGVNLPLIEKASEGIGTSEVVEEKAEDTSSTSDTGSSELSKPASDSLNESEDSDKSSLVPAENSDSDSLSLPVTPAEEPKDSQELQPSDTLDSVSTDLEPESILPPLESSSLKLDDESTDTKENTDEENLQALAPVAGESEKPEIQ